MERRCRRPRDRDVRGRQMDRVRSGLRNAATGLGLKRPVLQRRWPATCEGAATRAWRGAASHGGTAAKFRPSADAIRGTSQRRPIALYHLPSELADFPKTIAAGPPTRQRAWADFALKSLAQSCASGASPEDTALNNPENEKARPAPQQDGAQNPEQQEPTTKTKTKKKTGKEDGLQQGGGSEPAQQPR